MEKRAIVTGYFGYIGNVLTKLLKENDYYVVGIDTDSRSVYDIYDKRNKYVDESFLCDIKSTRTNAILDRFEDATVFHLAASSLLGPSAFDPLLYFNNNTAKTTSLMNNIGKDRRFIFESTAATYAITDIACYEDISFLVPPNNYGLSKLMTEQMIRSCYDKMNWKSVAFRFFNVAGAYEDVGQLPNTPHILNRLIDCYKNSETFIINGNDYMTPDGTCIRDYVHVIDIARAMIHMDNILRQTEFPYFNSYNLGSSKGFSVNQIVNKFQELVGNIKTEIGPRREGDPQYLVANNDKFIRETGFNYLHDDLDYMINSAMEYRKI